MSAAIDIQGLVKDFAPPLLWLKERLGRGNRQVVRALRDVSLRVEPGEVFGLVGRNGQGKTTLIKSTCGLLEPTRGTVHVFGHHTLRDRIEVRKQVGLVSADERTFYFRLTGRENLRFFGALHGIDAAPLERRIGLLSEQFELGPVLDRKFQDYSTGNKQRLSIVRALLPEPPLLLLDEPTRSLDPISAEALRMVIARWASMSARNTVLITTHNLAEVERLCARVAILSRGRIIECDGIDALKRKYAGRERIQLELGSALPDDSLAPLRAGLTELSQVSSADGRARLSFLRRPDDDALTEVMRAVLTAGVEVLGCDTEHYGLQQILEQVEANEAAP